MGQRKLEKSKLPEVSRDTWVNLVAAAVEFRDLAPWEFMYDSDLVGILDPDTGKVRLASILGNAGEFFALVVYRGQSGVRWILQMVREETPDMYDFDWGISQDCLKIEFTTRREADARDIAILKEVGFKSSRRTSHPWPIFRSHRPGCSPWYIDQAEAETLLADVRKVTEFARLVKQDPKLFEKHSAGPIPFLPNHSESPKPLRLQDVAWHSIVLPPNAPPSAFECSEALSSELAKLPQKTKLRFEINHFYAPAMIQEGVRPWFPKMMLVIDAESGLIIGMKMAEDMDATFTQVTGEGLIETFKKMGGRPGELHVIRNDLRLALEPFAKALGIRILQREHLPMFEIAYDAMRRDFRKSKS